MFRKLEIPLAYSIVKKGTTTVFVKERYKEIIPRLVFDIDFLSHRYKDDTNVKVGRGSYLTIPITRDSAERLIIRDYRHGGLLGKLLGGIFYDGNRPFNEIKVNEFAIQKGIPSPEVIAITRKKLWGLFYRANFISKELSGAVDIIQFIKESSLNYIQKSKKSVIFALVRLIRNMHDAGIYHADLHLKNILLRKEPNGEFQAYIIDLDKSVIFNNLVIDQRIKNLLRLDRSLEKLRWLSGKRRVISKNMKYNGNYPSPIHLQGRRGRGIGENGVLDKNYQVNVSVSQTDKSGEGTEHASMIQKINLISTTDKVRFLKSYMLYNQALDKDWKRYIRQYRSHYSLHKFWWCVFGSCPKNMKD